MYFIIDKMSNIKILFSLIIIFYSYVYKIKGEMVSQWTKNKQGDFLIQNIFEYIRGFMEF